MLGSSAVVQAPTSKCPACGLDMRTAPSCTADRWNFGADRIPFGKESHAGASTPKRCHDCGVPQGGFHHLYCDLEECPKCHGQALYCGCSVAPDERGEADQHGFRGPRVYFLSDVMRVTGAKRSQVENWVRSGWLSPEGQSSENGGGTGHHRTFSFANLVDIAIATRLSAVHIPLQAFFRSGSIHTIRGLFIPGESTTDGKTDAEIAEWLTDGWTEDDWTETLQQHSDKRGKPVTRDEFNAWYVAKHREGEASRRAAWAAFQDPATRVKEQLYALVILAERGSYTVYVHSDGDLSVWDTAIVINLGTLFDELEYATGDRWGS
jgi:hypothetical protein